MHARTIALSAAGLAVLGTLGLAAPASAGRLDPKIKTAVGRALDWLSREQKRQGYWEANQSQYRVAMTALAGNAMACEGSTTTRRVLESRWCDAGDGVLRYEIRATAFCWQMVRAVVGTLVEVGTGRLRPGDVMGILRARDRALAGNLAPPHGLCLWEVGYSD